MRHKSFTAALLLAMAATLGALAAEQSAPAPQVTIARFEGNRAAALSFTFDDGLLGQYKVAAPLLEKYGFRGTFFIIPDRVAASETATTAHVDDKGFAHAAYATWQDWCDLAARGHEIGNHTLDHKKLPGLTDEEARRQVAVAQRLITEKVGQAPVSFAYPGNGRDARVRKIVEESDPFTREHEAGNGGSNFTMDKVIAAGEWKVLMIHAVDEIGYAPLAAAKLEANLKYLSGLTNQVWVETFGHVSRYVGERDAAQLIVREHAPGRIVFTMTCPLDAHIFNAPLTAMIDTGTKQATAITAQREGGPAPKIVGEKAGTVLVDAVPGPGAITVTWR